MVVGEVLAGMALVRSGVDFIKGNITAAQDIGKFVSAIDNILDGEDQIQKRRSGKAGVGGIADEFGIKTTAHEVIDAKLAAEQRYEMSLLIDHRFGNGTWAEIVALRAKRIQEAKEEAKRIQKERAAKQQEIMEIGMVIAVVVVAAGALIGLLYVFARN